MKTRSLLVWSALQLASLAGGAEVRYSIDPSASFLEIVPGVPNPNLFEGFRVTQGSYFADTFAVIPRRNGSLRAPIAGGLVTDRVGARLTFSGGSSLTALTAPGGPFSPPGSLTGSGSVRDNFGAFGAFIQTTNLIAELALRDAVADIVSGSVTINQAATQLRFEVVQGTLDYQLDPNAALLAGVPEVGWEDLAVQLPIAPNDSLQAVTESSTGVLRIPFELYFPYGLVAEGDSAIEMRGLIVAVPVATLAGDFNTDGKVDAADYTVWRDSQGTSSAYGVWRANYGARTSATAVPVPTIAVPEPSGAVVAGGLLAGLARRRSL